MRIFSAILTVATLLSAAASLASANQKSADARFETCKKKLKQSHQLEVLYAFDWKPGKSPYIVAGPTFHRIPIDAKEGFAQALNCFLVAGQEGKCMNFDILDRLTGKPVARFEYCKFRML